MDKELTKINKWLILVILFVMPPFGVVFLWFSNKYSLLMKSILTLIFTIYFAAILIILGSV